MKCRLVDRPPRVTQGEWWELIVLYFVLLHYYILYYNNKRTTIIILLNNNVYIIYYHYHHFIVLFISILRVQLHSIIVTFWGLILQHYYHIVECNLK